VDDDDAPEVERTKLVPPLEDALAADQASHPIDAEALLVVGRRAALAGECGVNGVGLITGHLAEDNVVGLAGPRLVYHLLGQSTVHDVGVGGAAVFHPQHGARPSPPSLVDEAAEEKHRPLRA